jgi:hypothetical protein
VLGLGRWLLPSSHCPTLQFIESRFFSSTLPFFSYDLLLFNNFFNFLSYLLVVGKKRSTLDEQHTGAPPGMFPLCSFSYYNLSGDVDKENEIASCACAKGKRKRLVRKTHFT